MPSTFSTFLKFAHFKSEGKVDERAHVKYGKPGQFAAKRSRDKCPYRYSQILNTTLESLTNYLIQYGLYKKGYRMYTTYTVLLEVYSQCLTVWVSSSESSTVSRDFYPQFVMLN